MSGSHYQLLSAQKRLYFIDRMKRPLTCESLTDVLAPG